MINILELGSFVLVISALILSSLKVISLKSKNTNLKLDIIKNTYDILALKSQLDKNNVAIEQTPEFLKFLSDSRDAAFSYIEEVQGGLTKFINDIEPEINYFKEYGDVGSMAPNYYSLKKISEAYEELKALLPKENHGKIDI